MTNLTKQYFYSHDIRTSEKILLLFLFMLILMIKVFFLKHANTLPDEAYYWLWSKKIALSYFDHPPLNSWAQALLSSFVINKYFVIRAIPFFCLGIVLVINIVWQRIMFERLNYGAVLKSVVLFLSFPIFAIFFSISFPDYLLVTLLTASSFSLFLYFENNKNRKKTIYFWYLSVFLFSLALLTKYNAALFGIGVLSYILYHNKRIEGPSYTQLIVSIFIVMLMQTPVFLWNISNDFASFSFHLSERLDNEKNILTIFKNTSGFLLGVLLAFSPIFIFNLRNNFFSADYSNDKKDFILMSKFILVFSITFCILISFFTNVLYYWLTPAIVLLFPFLIKILSSKVSQYLHISYGMLVSLILVINVSVYPISAFFGDVDRETAILFGWKKIIENVQKEKNLYGTQKVIFSDYRLGSLYIFHSDDFETDVVMEGRRTQFDIWRNEEDELVKNALIISDKDFPIGSKILSSFKTITFVRDIEIFVGNKFIRKYQIFLAVNR